MNDNSIIFTATYSYLALPQYKAIVPELIDYHKILFNPNDPISMAFDNNHITTDIISNFFDEYYELKDISFDIRGKWWKIHNYRKYQKTIITYLTEIKPIAVLSSSDMTLSDRIISSWCLKKKIPFFVIQPALLGGEYSFGKKSIVRYSMKQKIRRMILNRLLGVPLLRKQHLFGNEDPRTYLLLWSEYFARNPSRQNTFFVGNPAFDEIFKKFKEKRNRNLKNNIVICTQDIEVFYGVERVRQVIDMYKKAIESKPNITFYIKVHPREPIVKYEKIFDKKDFPNVKIVKDVDLHELFMLCDVQISFASTTSFDAAAMGLPSIIPNPNNSFELFDHFRGEIEIKVTKLENMKKAIDTTLSDDYWEEFLQRREKFFKKTLYSTDGQSGRRAAEKIKELISLHKQS